VAVSLRERLTGIADRQRCDSPLVAQTGAPYEATWFAVDI
jgi:hypothetical protein